MIINSDAWWDLLLFMLVLSNSRNSPSLKFCGRVFSWNVMASHPYYVYFRIFITVSNCLELALRRCRFHSKQNGKLFNCYSIIHTIHWNYFFKRFFNQLYIAKYQKISVFVQNAANASTSVLYFSRFSEPAYKLFYLHLFYLLIE